MIQAGGPPLQARGYFRGLKIHQTSPTPTTSATAKPMKNCQSVIMRVYLMAK
jgi:hypothetical protein